MISNRILLSMLVLCSASSIALAQTKENKALQQLKDQKQSSQDAAATRNPEQSKVKSNQGFDTAQPPVVRAGPPSTKTKAERDAEAIKAYTSQPPTGQAERQRLQRTTTIPPSPGAAAPVKPSPVVAAPAKPVVAKPAPVVAVPAKPATVAATPAKPAPVAAAPVKPSTSTFTTSSAPSTSATSSTSSSSSRPSSSNSKR